MKLLVLVGTLVALVACAEGGYLTPCRENNQNANYCPYKPPHECDVPGKTCRYGQECCHGPCYNECQLIVPPYTYG